MDCERDLPCSVNSLQVGEGLAGTAPEALGWIAIEQPGPYGHDALLDSHFPRKVGEWLRESLPKFGIKPILIRAPGRHADVSPGMARRVYLACSRPGRSVLGTLTIDDPQQLTEIDYAALAVGEIGAAHPDIDIEEEPLLLVCTHAKRDMCCALRGRPIVEALAQGSDRVWECSHLGGHRFAPVALQLPHGWVYGRFDLDQGRRILSAAESGQIVLEAVRGRSSHPPLDQIDDLERRRSLGMTSAI